MKPKAIRGMNDVLPDASATWRYVETVVREVIESYGYREIRLPILEQTELFRRSIGEVTDIVEKEMYTFLDRNDESITMRPEATAGMVRAGITNGLFHNKRRTRRAIEPIIISKNVVDLNADQLSVFTHVALGEYRCPKHLEAVLLESAYLRLIEMKFFRYFKYRNTPLVPAGDMRRSIRTDLSLSNTSC